MNKNAKKSQGKKESFKDALCFIPLGGAEEFGVNLNVYAADGKFLAVDCGIGFADERYPGIDLLLPDPKFLEDNRDNLQGMIITHAHEDHIGAVAYLWECLGCTLYASPFTAIILREKLHERGIKNAPIQVIRSGGAFRIGSFGIEFIRVTHSIPEAYSLVIETRYGRVLHSGDWNLDPSPAIGAPVDSALFRDAGKKGILAYVGDSTNAEVPGRSGTEASVEQGLLEEFRNCEGRIAITLFSSNIGRIISIARAAEKCGRRVCVIGRSLHRMIGAAVECGYMKNAPEFIDEEDIGSLKDKNIAIILTGSQGEARSALAKIARGEFRNFSLKKTDTVIFSARGIPGNEVNINVVKNDLAAAGVRVVTPSDTVHVIHVSGHPCRDEITDMYDWVKPQIVIPVHGERTQLEAQAALARARGIKDVIVPVNGAVIRLAPGTPAIIDHVETGLLAVDQKRVIDAAHSSIRERRKLQYTGAVHVTIVMDGKSRMIADPQISTMGLLDPENSAEQKIEDNLYNEILDIIDDMNSRDLRKDDVVTEDLRAGVRRFFLDTIGIKPVVSVHLLRV
ncbi:MAG: ribonuclease J [Alphaproteobacteria bacterium]